MAAPAVRADTGSPSDNAAYVSLDLHVGCGMLTDKAARSSSRIGSASGLRPADAMEGLSPPRLLLQDQQLFLGVDPMFDPREGRQTPARPEGGRFRSPDGQDWILVLRRDSRP